MQTHGDKPARRRPHQRRSQQTHAALLRAAEDGFSTDGWRGTSIEGLAASAGTSVGSVYSRFGSKRDLLLAVVAQRVNDMMGLVEEPASPDDPVSGIKETVTTAVRRRRGAAGLLQAWADACTDHPDLRQLETGIRETVIKKLQDSLEQFQTYPGLRPGTNFDQMAIAVCGLLESVHHPPWTELSDETVAEICTRFIVHAGISDEGVPKEFD